MLRTRVFIDTSDELCLTRRLNRDVQQRGRSPAAVRSQYELTVRPMFERHVLPTRRHADRIIGGHEPIDRLVAEVLAATERS